MEKKIIIDDSHTQNKTLYITHYISFLDLSSQTPSNVN